ncbi:MAG TPA: sigma-70 family RNA polymerase sigma factor [Solirubrobacteraceae bacterium]|nr:sigma-70 family RNA polymerase sigma factor [Solirubrobacteraceae bacterium]
MERELVVAAEGGDEEARGQLVESFLPAIRGLARRFAAGSGVQPSDLTQEGIAGLLFAARRYDPRMETPFWAYASFWVRKAMQDLLSEMMRPVVLSDHAARGLAQIRSTRRDYVTAHGAEPTTDELAAATGFTRAQFDSLLAVERPPRRLDEPLEADDGEGPATLGDTIADPKGEDEYQHVLDEMEVRDYIGRLDERERTVLWRHYGLGRPAQTLSQIGAGLGVSAERVRQIEAEALKKLRDAAAQPPNAQM